MHDTRTSYLQTSWLWVGMMGAPVLWGLHLLVIWFADEFGCRIGVGDSRVLGISLLHLFVLGVSLLAGAGVMATGFIAYRNWRELEAVATTEREAHFRAWERGRFMALLGLGFSGLFLLVMVYMTIPVFLLPACS